ncbi:unnamed protein product [Adineta ricciae]|uniref:Fasciculation and elongation protein zeta-2 n=1 Tax=Adineta ricciae TaxID=249248 RepID=A0A815PK38_ADIRI|nr:unnamed protein product [Adineta ricciae]
MSFGINEKQLLYDNPCAPVVKFSYSTNLDDDDDDMTDERINSNTSIEILLHPSLENSYKACSLEDLVQSFDQTIHACFPEELAVSKANVNPTPNTWSELVEKLHQSLRQDLKLPHSRTEMSNLQDRYSYEDDIQSIDNLTEDEEEDLHEAMVSSKTSPPEPFLTAEKVINETDFMLKDMTPDSGFCDDMQEGHFTYDSYDLKYQTTASLNQLADELNDSIRNLSSILVRELADRDELEDEKEMKNTFISLVLSIQNKRQYYQNEKRQKRRALFGNTNSIEPGTDLTTVIPYDRDHPSCLSLKHIQNLNQILNAINDNSPQVPDLLTKYILKVVCSS